MHLFGIVTVLFRSASTGNVKILVSLGISTNRLHMSHENLEICSKRLSKRTAAISSREALSVHRNSFFFLREHCCFTSFSLPSLFFHDSRLCCCVCTNDDG
uniref:Putative secreted protein n=1 Tax=Anopheles marajoara TaxID=58244 RepID=A0A2M4C9A2_9DIPT